MSAEQVELPYEGDEERYAGLKWMDFAACLDEDPELFFPIGKTGPAQVQIEEAKAVCRKCDVRERCLDFALASRLGDWGIWGGMSEDERRALKKRKSARTT